MDGNEKLCVQRGRIEKLAAEITPHGRVEFDLQIPNRIAFKIVDGNTDTVLAVSGQLHVKELAGKSDDWVRQYIRQLGGGDL
jgi:hypothetical protein